MVYDRIAAFLGIGPLDSALSWLAGLPLLTPGQVPGTLPLALLGAAVAIALVAAPVPHPSPRSPAAMLAVLALATPAAVGLYSLLSNDLFLFPRSLTASLPFVALLVGSALVRPRAPVAAAAVALAAAGIGAGAVQAGQDRNSRPDFPEAADLIDELARPADPVAYALPGIEATRLRSSLQMYYDRPHPALLGDDPRVWAARRHSSRLVVVAASPVGRPAPRLPEVPGMTRHRERELPGLSSLAVGFYRAR